MTLSAIVTVIYGILLAVGGIMGKVKAGSTPSLISGLVSGALALAFAALMAKHQRAGLYLALVLAIALAIFGGKSWLVDGKAFMPRGLIFILSLIEIVVVAVGMMGR